MDQPKIPTLKDSQKPQVKVRGLGGGLTLMDRMKQFKKKDLAFILAGLGTLFMAPLAEHFMMSPENGDASSSGTFGPGGGGPGGNGNGIFGVDRGGGSGDGTAPGGPAGGGSDVITPLNVRDPSALIMGPGSAQQPQVGSSAPAAPPVTAPSGHNDNDVRDALAASAVHAANAALGKTPLPMPKIGLSNNTLRGLGVISGGSSASAGGGGLATPGQTNFSRNVGSNAPGVKGGNNISAVTRGPGQGGTSLDALKAQAGKVFDRSDLASPTVNPGSSAQVSSSGGTGGGNGAGGVGSNDKAGGGNSAKEAKSTGTSLAYELMKQNLQKQLELYWKEKEAMDPTLELYKIRNSMAESIAGSIGSAIGSWAGNSITSALGGPGAGYYCCGDGMCQSATNVSTSLPCTTNTTTPSGTSGGAGTQSTQGWAFVGGRLVNCQTQLPYTPSGFTPQPGAAPGIPCFTVGGASSTGTTPPPGPTPTVPTVGGGDHTQITGQLTTPGAGQ